MEQVGTALSLKDGKVFQGGATHNGFLLKNHSYDLTVGYSKLTPHATIAAKFGFGVWVAGNSRDNKVTTVMPGTNPQAHGILISNGFIRQGQPAAPDTINDYNKALVAVRGFVRYKTGYTAAGVESQAYTDISKGMFLQINQLNGQFHFNANATVAGFSNFGKVILMNPDDQSWVVELTC